MKIDYNTRHGFTLIELSVVIVIIGLIIGGIMVGRDMIRSSQLQAMLGEYDSYLKAIKEFQDKYQALPGDMVGAQAIWGTDPGGCPGSASATATPKIATCDGDASGTIGSSDQYGNTSNYFEWYRAWQQLSDAGLVSGMYSGLPTAVGRSEAIPSINVPTSKLTGGGWSIIYQLFPGSVDLTLFTGHMLAFGAYTPNLPTFTAVLTPAEAFGIDSKIDDGVPGTGNVRDRVNFPPEPNCAINSGSNPAPANTAYVIANTNPACAPFFLLGF